MRLEQVLFSQGFGTRRECEALIRAGEVSALGRVIDEPAADLPTEGLVFSVQGESWPFHELAFVLLHKPANCECSTKPRHHRSVFDLLPAPLRRRGVQPVGRLDADTTGALLLTDDGVLLHRLTSPKQHVRKVYEARTAEPVNNAQIEALLHGVVLRDDPKPVRAVACESTGERALRLTLDEGRYHQVRRMVAAAGNHVEALHRSAFGALTLPQDLAPGTWRWCEAHCAAAIEDRG